MSMTAKTWLLMLLAAAIGAGLALWLVCPTLCTQGVQSKLAGALQSLGLSSQTSSAIAQEFI